MRTLVTSYLSQESGGIERRWGRCDDLMEFVESRATRATLPRAHQRMSAWAYILQSHDIAGENWKEGRDNYLSGARLGQDGHSEGKKVTCVVDFADSRQFFKSMLSGVHCKTLYLKVAGIFFLLTSKGRF